MPKTIHPSHPAAPYELSLSDGVYTHGLKLAADEDPPALQEEPQRASTLLHGPDGELQVGDPGLIYTEQGSWHAGQSPAGWAENPHGFAHSAGAWSLTAGKLLPAPRVSFPQGLVESMQHLAGNLSWAALLGASRYLSVPFTIGASAFTPVQVSVWLRRFGSPGTLRVEIWSDDGAGKPGSAIANASALLTASDIPDTPSVWHTFTLDTPPTLTAGTTYHLVVHAETDASAANHWRIGVDAETISSHASTVGTTWAGADFTLFHRLLPASVANKFHLFNYQGAYYAAASPADGSAASLYINGARGLTTAAGSSALTDTDQSWIVDHWAGAWLRISAGKGLGKVREILSNTADTLTLAEAWDETPDTSSQYVIYATPHWSALAGSGFVGAVTGLAEANGQIFFAQGSAGVIRKMRFNPAATPPAHEFASDTQSADRLHVFTDPLNGLQLWRGVVGVPKIARAAAPNWGVNLSFGAALTIGGRDHPLTNIFDTQGQLWVIKPDGCWTVTQEPGYPDQITALNHGLATRPDAHTGNALLMHEAALHFSWGAGLARLDDESLSPLPAHPGGEISALLAGGPGWLLALAHGTDSLPPVLLVYQDESWHPLFTGSVGQSAGALGWQSCPGAHDRLWFAIGGELRYLDFPEEGTDPALDASLAFQHEAVITLPEMHLGVLRAPKFFKSLTLLTERLTDGAHVLVDVQVDEEIGGVVWRQMGAAYRMPEDEIPLRLGAAHRIQIRLRLQSGTVGNPPSVLAAVLAGFVRTPLKYRWRVHLNLDDTPDPARLLAWLKENAAAAQPLTLRALWPDLDNRTVILEPPRITRTRKGEGEWGGRVMLVMREG